MTSSPSPATAPTPAPGVAFVGTFDPERLLKARLGGHVGALNIGYRAHGEDWIELDLPYADKLVGDPASGVMASGAILALMDMACGMSIWIAKNAFVPQATLDLRIDYLRPATPGKTVTGRGECYRLTRSIAFVRGLAHDGDPADPLAQVAATFMFTGPLT